MIFIIVYISLNNKKCFGKYNAVKHRTSTSVLFNLMLDLKAEYL